MRYLTNRQAEVMRWPAGTFGVDALHQTVHVGGTTRSLAKRPGLWSLMSVLLTEPGRVRTADELAQHAWGIEYDAVRHRSRLVVSISRLRELLGAEMIAAVGGGYRLSVPNWAVLEPKTGTG
jgi:DNA-binding response OmpR family regulator